jgi:FkbM family methyltransferase
MALAESLIDTLRPIRFRGKARLLNRFLARDGERTTRVFGYRMKLDLAEYIQRMIYLGAYERQETRWVRRWLRRGMTFVDVGANVGYYSLLAASRVGPEGRIFALEPSPVAAGRLKATVQENRLENVRVVQAGLSDRPAESLLFLPPGDNHTPSMLGGDGCSSVPVFVRTLDDCLAEWQLDRIDLLKVDVEGYEPRVFAGGEQALVQGQIRAILCEFNDPWLQLAGSNAQALYERLADWGFTDLGGKVQSFSNQVFTRFLVHDKTSHR